MKKCAQCGATNKPVATVCAQCGAPLDNRKIDFDADQASLDAAGAMPPEIPHDDVPPEIAAEAAPPWADLPPQEPGRGEH